MTAEFSNMFTNSNAANAASTRELSGTAQLTDTAIDIANQIIAVMNEDIDNYRVAIKESQKDNGAMDQLINRAYGSLADVDVEFLSELPDETIDGMLKSQQSKRSRCKGKAMTMDNYKSLLTAAIAENLIRLATGKVKGTGGARRLAGVVEYTAAELAQFESDQEALRREIRNVQSKKSIMKSKADFDETSERWQTLLRVEQQLKDLRVGGTTEVVVEVDTTKNALTDLMAGIDTDHLKAADSKELLAKIASLINNQ